MPTSVSGQEKAKFELLHLWAEDIEAHALLAFSEPMIAAGVEWKEHVVRTNFNGVRNTLSERLAHDVPPTASFWIGGGSVVAELIEQGIFKEITTVAGNWQLSDRLLPEVLEAVRYRDGISVLPVGIHLQNFMVYNQTILEEIAEPVPKSWEEFIRVAEKAKRAGYTPLSMSDQAWQVRFLIGAIMAQYLSPEEMQVLASVGKTEEPQRKAIRLSFEILNRLRPYLNKDFHDLSWKKAVDHVVDGRAMANALGDFVAPLTLGRNDLICALPPGNQYVTWSFDSIALTNTTDPSEVLGQEQFISTVLDAENSARYIARKGGVPVVAEFDTSTLPDCAKVSVSEWKSSPTRVRLMKREWTRSMAVIANFGRDYLKNPNSDLDVVMRELFASLENLQSQEVID